LEGIKNAEIKAGKIAKAEEEKQAHLAKEAKQQEWEDFFGA